MDQSIQEIVSQTRNQIETTGTMATKLETTIEQVAQINASLQQISHIGQQVTEVQEKLNKQQLEPTGSNAVDCSLELKTLIQSLGGKWMHNVRIITDTNKKLISN